jgi:hypothetical protein
MFAFDFDWFIRILKKTRLATTSFKIVVSTNFATGLVKCWKMVVRKISFS